MKRNIVLFVVLILLVVTAWIVKSRSGSSTLSDKPLSDFAISDTSTVNKIIITDQTGQHATLERIPGNGLWKLNGKYFAREDAVNIILMTINRIRIRGNVSDAARDNMMKLLVTSGKKVEIFTGGKEPAKIYYVGVPTPDHTGTMMLLEIPGIGRSEDPFITHIEGFTGFLSTRFFTNETEWRYTGIFNYPELAIRKVKVIHHLQPASSFEVTFDGGNNFQLYSGYDEHTGGFNSMIAKFDTIAVKNLLVQFKKVHVESFLTNLKSEAADSIKKSMPAYSISVENDKGVSTSVDLYLRLSASPEYNEDGTVNPWDVGHFWAKTQDNELALAQTYNFGPLVNPIDAYIGR